MVVKFFDAVRRAELSIKLKKRKAKLRSRLKELEELVAKENDISRIRKFLFIFHMKFLLQMY